MWEERIFISGIDLRFAADCSLPLLGDQLTIDIIVRITETYALKQHEQEPYISLRTEPVQWIQL